MKTDRPGVVYQSVPDQQCDHRAFLYQLLDKFRSDLDLDVGLT